MVKLIDAASLARPTRYRVEHADEMGGEVRTFAVAGTISQLEVAGLLLSLQFVRGSRVAGIILKDLEDGLIDHVADLFWNLRRVPSRPLVGRVRPALFQNDYLVSRIMVIDRMDGYR